MLKAYSCVKHEGSARHTFGEGLILAQRFAILAEIMRLRTFICFLLAAVTLAIYWPARHFDLIYYDDPYFLLTTDVAQGLNWTGIDWAMTAVIASNWHPVTSFSFLMTHHFFGLNPGAEHQINILFHAANAVLLFLVLTQMTGATWRSAMVSALFAWHPLRVESVAWITERKDVLFAFFILFALWCYTKYAKSRMPRMAIEMKGPAQPAVSPVPGNLPPGAGWYLLTLVFFAFSLMSKAMMVTFPFLLLLLDFWPLQRFQHLNWPSLRKLIIEKIPFFVMSFFSCSITFQVQKSTGAVVTAEALGTAGRLENATLNYVYYLGKFLWPGKLALLYPYPTHFDAVEVLLAILLLLAISILCLLQVTRRPYLAVGWFWYLGTLVPVIGLVQIGEAAMADRYTYFPLIGPVISLVWLVSEWAAEWPRPVRPGKYLTGAAAAVILAVYLVLTRNQVRFWQNTANLFTHTVAVTPENGMVQFPLAQGLEEEGQLRQAAVHYRMAIAMKPDVFHYQANLSFAALLNREGFYQEADSHLEMALQLTPDSAMAMNNLAWMLATCPDAKVRNGARAVELGERLCEMTGYQATVGLGTLAAAYAEAGRYDDAIRTAQQAMALAQEHGETALARNNEALLQYYLAHKAYRDKGHLTSDGT